MQRQDDLAKITCVVDDHVLAALNAALQTLEIPEVYLQRAKQVMLVDHARFLGLHTYTTPEENRAALCRFYVPRQFQTGVMRQITEALDLYLPGRGSIYAKEVTLLRRTPLEFNTKLLTELCGEAKPEPTNYDVLACIVQRGAAAAIAAAILEMGLSVPLISFAAGMGGRDRMGLLRITVPVDKEIMYFLAPRHDAELLKGIIERKARLDLPGHGFLYQYHVNALAVNLRVRRGNRTSAATMEQIITALDQLRGSSEWRRLGVTPVKKEIKEIKEYGKEAFSNFSLIIDEGLLTPYVQTALRSGAGGATRMPLIFQSYAKKKDENALASGSKEVCDLVVPQMVSEMLAQNIKDTDFFTRPEAGMIEITSVHGTITYTGKDRVRGQFGGRNLFALLRKTKN